MCLYICKYVYIIYKFVDKHIDIMRVSYNYFTDIRLRDPRSFENTAMTISISAPLRAYLSNKSMTCYP
jgi:hypothetical protein